MHGQGQSYMPSMRIFKVYLVSEGAGHDEAGVPGGAPKVHKASLCEDNDAGVGLGENPSVCLRLDRDALHARVGLQPQHVNLIVKVPDVADDGIVLHLLHVVDHDDIFVPGGRDKDVCLRDYILNCEDRDPFHQSLEGTDRIDLGHDHTGTSLLECSSAALANISVPTDNCNLTGNHDIGRPHQTIGEGVAASIQVIKLFAQKQRDREWRYQRSYN